MNPTFAQIVGPAIDLRAFVQVVGQDEVNRADVARVDVPAKFADLTSKCFDNRFQPGYEHLYLSFYFELPLMLDGMLREYIGLNLKHMAEYNGMMSQGIVSGSFVDWRRFLEWCTNEDRELSLRKFGNWIYESHFRSYAFFAGFTRTNLTDKTFMLT